LLVHIYDEKEFCEDSVFVFIKKGKKIMKNFRGRE
jgi:hypothetical protein